MWFVSSTFKNLDEVNKWLKKANDKFKNTKQENITLENLDISYVRYRDSHPNFSNIMKSSVIKIGDDFENIEELAKSVFVVADRLKRACDDYLLGKVDQEIIEDIEYVRGCSKAVKDLQKRLNKFKGNIFYKDGKYTFELSSEEDKGEIKQIIETAMNPFNSNEDINRIKKNLKKYFNKTNSKNFSKTWTEFVGQLACIYRCLSIPECVSISTQKNSWLKKNNML